MNKNTALFAVLAFRCSSQRKHFDIVRQQYGHQYGNGKVEVKIKYGKSTEQYEISKVRYVNFFWRLLYVHRCDSLHKRVHLGPTHAQIAVMKAFEVYFALASYYVD